MRQTHTPAVQQYFASRADELNRALDKSNHSNEIQRIKADAERLARNCPFPDIAAVFTQIVEQAAKAVRSLDE